mmetsp:Transcript_63093/g.149510  ORF Transcript_63093/g.149510 Transcript_63093/m.149510 type:complete len:175 (-) Transcript_63093:153-677(-)
MDILVPCTDAAGNWSKHVVMAFADSSSAITAGREVWGFPLKFASPKITVNSDTVVARLDYSGLRVATVTMPYKPRPLAAWAVVRDVETPETTVKLIPGPDGAPAVAQLVQVQRRVERVHDAWTGSGRVALFPHAHATVADLPVLDVLGAEHTELDLWIGPGMVLHDYLDEHNTQ